MNPDRYFTSVRDNVLRALWWSRLETKLLRRAHKIDPAGDGCMDGYQRKLKRARNLRAQANVAHQHSISCGEQAQRLLREAHDVLRITHVTMLYREERQ